MGLSGLRTFTEFPPLVTSDLRVLPRRNNDSFVIGFQIPNVVSHRLVPLLGGSQTQPSPGQ